MTEAAPRLFHPPNLTASHSDISLLKNKLWRIQNLYKIKDKDRNLVKLRLNTLQWEIWKRINAMKPIRYFNLKYRQGGVSTFFLIWWLDDTIFNTNTTTGILSHKKESLNYLMDIIRIAHRNMPTGLQPKLGDDSKSALSFPDVGSRIMVSLSIRSTAVHNLHVSEWCLAKDEEVQASIGAAGPNANITGETTGNGVGNYGYEVYQDAKQGDNGYVSHFVPWFLQKEYAMPLNGIAPNAIIGTLKPDERKLRAAMLKDYGMQITPEQVLWRRWAEKNYKGLRGQEFPETDEEAFRTSGTKFFDYKKIHKLMLAAKKYIAANVSVEESDDFIQFEKPIKGDIYAAGADTAEGGGDCSVLKIINVTRNQEAFVYRARCGVDRFYKICDQWGRFYNRALLAVERNNHGHAVLLGLDETCRYPNLYKEQATIKAIDDKFPKEKLGWLTSVQTRPLMLDGLKMAIEGESDEDEEHFTSQVQVFDVQLLKEMLTFEDIDGKFQAVAGETDDDVFASAIAFQMYFKLLKYTHANKLGGFSDRIQVGGQREAV